MEPFLRVLKDLFVGNYITIVILTFAWIPIYFLKKLLDVALPKLFLRFPIYFGVRFWRKIHSIPSHPADYFDLRDSLPFDPDEKKKKVAAMSNKIEKILSAVVFDQKLFVRLFFEYLDVASEAKKSMKGDVGILEADFALLEALSRDLESSYRGILSYSNSPTLSNKQSLEFLVSVLRTSGSDLSNKVLHILATKAKTQRELSDIMEVVDGRGQEFKDQSSEILEKIARTINETEEFAA